MGRRIIYKIERKPENVIAEYEWAELQKLQHWYNSEFVWSSGKLLFKRYVIFPNTEDFSDLDSNIWEIIRERRQWLAGKGCSDIEIVRQLEKDGLVSVKWGGYFDACWASGFTRVVDNEWNAYLVCDFLLKASTILSRASLLVEDEGRFIKTGKVYMKQGEVFVPGELLDDASIRTLVDSKHLFSVVDPEKYEKHQGFKNIIPEFHKLNAQERLEHLRHWNWLGYDDAYDENGDDRKGFDLNVKVRAFHLLPG